MITLKKKEAFEKAKKVFGPWNTWGRSEHLAYGLIRGVPYEKMERYCNDNPLAMNTDYALWKLGAWPENVPPSDGKFHCIPREFQKEVCNLIVWVRKPVKIKILKEESVAL